jgi:hypothetical protein
MGIANLIESWFQTIFLFISMTGAIFAAIGIIKLKRSWLISGFCIVLIAQILTLGLLLSGNILVY